MLHNPVAHCDNCGCLYDHQTGQLLNAPHACRAVTAETYWCSETECYFCSLDCALEFLEEVTALEEAVSVC
jgi:hypothetical protein